MWTIHVTNTIFWDSGYDIVVVDLYLGFENIKILNNTLI